jgi:translocator protein
MTRPSGLDPLPAAALTAVPLAVSGVLAMLHPPAPGTETFRWYRALDKPSFTPPDPAFGIAWTAIQAGLAWGGYRLFRGPPSRAAHAAAALWSFNVAMIGGWSELFFGGKKLGASAAAAAGMLATGAAFSAVAAKTDRKAAATGLPYVAWLGFATVLAEEVWRRNRKTALAH